MSDQVMVEPNLRFWIEGDCIKCHEGKIFPDYLEFCLSEKKPFANLLKSYAEIAKGLEQSPTFQGFLLFCKSESGQRELRGALIPSSDETIESWGREYLQYQRKQNIEKPITLDDLSTFSVGKVWAPFLSAYLKVASEGDAPHTFSGFLTFVHEQLKRQGCDRSSTTLADVELRFINSITDDSFESKLNPYSDEWPTDKLRPLIDDLNQSPHLVSFLSKKSPENQMSVGLLKECFLFVCRVKELTVDGAEEVTIESLKTPEGANPATKLTEDLNEAWAIAAILFHRTMFQIPVVQSSIGTAALDCFLLEMKAKCDSGVSAVLQMLASAFQEERNGVRDLNSAALVRGLLSEKVLAAIEVCKNPTSTTPATPQESPSSSGGGFSEAVLQARFEGGMSY
jgi:hypothetical protein